MEVALPQLECQFDFSDPDALSNELEENPKSFSKFMREEVQRLRSDFVPLAHPDRDGLIQAFDASIDLVKNTVECIWSTSTELEWWKEFREHFELMEGLEGRCQAAQAEDPDRRRLTMENLKGLHQRLIRYWTSNQEEIWLRSNNMNKVLGRHDKLLHIFKINLLSGDSNHDNYRSRKIAIFLLHRLLLVTKQHAKECGAAISAFKKFYAQLQLQGEDSA